MGWGGEGEGGESTQVRGVKLPKPRTPSWTTPPFPYPVPPPHTPHPIFTPHTPHTLSSLTRPHSTPPYPSPTPTPHSAPTCA